MRRDIAWHALTPSRAGMKWPVGGWSIHRGTVGHASDFDQDAASGLGRP